ncbi:MAG: XisI protein [Saprospiraceae bacterium]
MEKLMQHKNIVRQIVEEIAAMIPADGQVETQLIVDEARGHYLLAAVGWHDDRQRELNTFVHLDVKPDGKVWIQHDGTDLRIALWLVEKGIPKSDIVLAFHAPHRREMIPEFAVA